MPRRTGMINWATISAWACLLCSCGKPPSFSGAQTLSNRTLPAEISKLQGCHVIVGLPSGTPVTPPDQSHKVTISMFVNNTECSGDYSYEFTSTSLQVWTLQNTTPQKGTIKLTSTPTDFNVTYKPTEEAQGADDLRIKIARVGPDIKREVAVLAGIASEDESKTDKQTCAEDEIANTEDQNSRDNSGTENLVYCSLKL
jgi:hypothetical protein